MKLLELEIHNFRGVRQIKIEPEAKNFLIWGPNGSGKSTIVDSLDFLLTGDVSRMKGRGTKGITIKKHGPYIDSDINDVEVEAQIQLKSVEKPLKIKRSLKNPSKLIYDTHYANVIEPVLELANRGQHILTRREILNYITADSSTRARQIEKLLKLDDVEKTRQSLNRTLSKLKKDYKTSEDVLQNSIKSIKNLMDINDFSEDLLLEFINKNRRILEGNDIENLNPELVKYGLIPPIKSENFINVNLVKRNIKFLQDQFSTEKIDERLKIAKRLIKLQEKISSNPEISDATNYLRLNQLGLNLIDDSGSCPLCRTSWDREKLEEQINNQINSLNVVKADHQTMEELIGEIISTFTILNVVLDELIPATNNLDLEKTDHKLESWQNLLKPFLDAETYQDGNYTLENIRSLLAPPLLSDYLDEILLILEKVSEEPSSEQNAWDVLTKLEINLKNYNQAKNDFNSASKAYRRAEILLNIFLNSRDKIIGSLFSEIEGRFIELYRELHGSDEAQFNAHLQPKGGGVELEVGFYGRGNHPPHALHSEGHQDSMGICLYLALAERLTEGYIDLIILDDVMMSVDAPHRREICRLLADFFKGRQFFITTHDQTWARQLKTEGVVNGRQMIELYNWTLEHGPYLNSTIDMWDKIEEDLERGDVNSAAFKLRRGSEEFFRDVCNQLGSSVTFKENQRWELGDFLPAALKSYRNLLKSAKVAADSWNNHEELDKLKKVERYSKEVFRRSHAESWAVNINVHYNKWADFSVADFRPVVTVFYDLFRLFQCDKCGGIIHLNKNGMNLEAVRCNCGYFNWNLVKKA